MRMTVGCVKAMSITVALASAVFLASAFSYAAETSEAFIIPLFPQKEAELKKGLPPGMTAYSFWAGRGTAKLRRLDDGKVEAVFDFEGLIPYGVYTLWNVLETNPFKDEPLGEFGAGKHSVVADGSGRAHKMVVLDKWPGKEFRLFDVSNGFEDVWQGRAEQIDDCDVGSDVSIAACACAGGLEEAVQGFDARVGVR